MPAAGLSPLRVAPEDVNADEAGELVKDLGVHNQAKGLLQAVARQMPKDLRVAMQREEHRQRSKFLDPDEVMERALEAVGEQGDRTAVKRVLGARVRAAKGDAFDGMVIVQYETPSGRTARCAIAHNEHTFPASIAAYNQAQREGKIELPGELSDATTLRNALEEERRENARLAAELHRRDTGEPGEHEDDLRHERIPGEDPDDPAPPAEVELPEGVEPGDPGWPTDPKTGELLVLPDEVRSQLVEAHEREKEVEAKLEEKLREVEEANSRTEEEHAAELERVRAEAEAAAAAQVPAQEGTTWPEDLSTVELPKGDSNAQIAGLPFYSTVVVAALAEHGSAQKTRDAAAAELENRPDKPAIAE